MKVSYAWLQTYFDKSLFKKGLPKPSRLEELFNAHAFEVEGMEKVAGDTVLDIKVLPDRAHYALSHKGMAREASAIANVALKTSITPAIDVQASVRTQAVKVEDSKLCPRYMARRIEGVNVADSPKWLATRLEAIGSRSINTIVDATNFVMFDLGQPLHAFDADKIKGSITVRKAKPGEIIELLPEKVTVDGKTSFKERSFALSESDIVIADDEGPVALAGVKGGKRAEVTSETKNIIIESANFNPTAVRRTSGKYNLRNDSSKRFENEITPALAAEAMDAVTALMLELSSGSKAGAITDIYPKPVKSWIVEAEYSYMNSVTGLSLSLGDMKDILTKLHCVVEEKNGKLLVTPPLDRLDLVIPEDIADEIARMYGYDKLASKDTPDISSVPMDKAYYWAEKAKNILVVQGFSETLLYALVAKGSFEIARPLASDKSALREAIAPKLKESLTINGRNADLLGLETVKVFEIGKVFPKDGERMSLCIGVSQIKKKKGVTADTILSATVAQLQKDLGVSLVSKVDITPAGAVVEFNFDALVAQLPEPGSLKDLGFVALPQDKKYIPFSPYPYIVRDIALFVPVSVAESDVQKIIAVSLAKTAGKLLIKGPDCFDRFEKDGKKSLAFRMIFQSFEKTLSDDEVNGFMTALYTEVKSKGWNVR